MPQVLPATGNRQEIRRGLTAPPPELFALDFTCAVLSGVLELAFSMAVGLFVDQLLPGQNWTLIVAASVVLLVTYLVNTGLMVVVNYWGHMLGINIETEMRRRSFRSPAEALISASTTTTRPGTWWRVSRKTWRRSGRSRAPRAGRLLHRHHDLHRRLCPHVLDQPDAGADHRGYRADQKPASAFVTAGE